MAAPDAIIWVERLSLADLARLLPESLLTGAEIRYDEHRASGSAGALARLIERIGLRRIRPAGFGVHERKPGAESPRYRRMDILGRCFEGPRGKLLSGEPARLVRAVESYAALYLGQRAIFMILAEDAAARAGARRNVLYFHRHPVNALLVGAVETPFEVRQSLSLRGHLRCALAPVLMLIRSLWKPLLPRRGLTSLRRPGPSVWVEYHEMEADGHLSSVFWKDEAALSGHDIVYYLDRRDIPAASPEAVSHITHAGFEWIDCRDPARWARLAWRDYRELFGRMLRREPGVPAWLKFFKIELDALTRLWAAVFRRFKVRLLIQHQEFAWETEAQARAVEDAGGIMAGFHWSYFHYDGLHSHLHPHHLFFVWGKAHFDWMTLKGHDCAHVLPCGVWLRPSGDPKQAAARLSPEVRFKLAVFDSTFGYEFFLSERGLSDFFRTVLDLLEAHPDWGAILKPKDEREMLALPEGESIVVRMEALKSAGRLVTLPRLASPLNAAMAADLAVCFNINSAGILAGARGKPCVHYDFMGWFRNPIYQESSQKVFFPTLFELRKAVEKAAGGDRTIGDFSPWRSRVDHFPDEKAGPRVGELFTAYFDGLRRGDSARKALDSAAAGYRKKHGAFFP